jgi:tight adherence protein B
MSPIILSVIIGVAIIAMVMGFVVLGSRDKAQQIARRLEGSAPVVMQESYESAASEQLMRDEGLSTLPWLNRALGNWSRIEYVRTLLAQAGMETKPGQILLTTGVVVLATYLVAHLFLGDLLFPVLYALALGCVPIGTVYYRRHKRMSGFEKNFPEAIDLLGRAVRAGHALNTGMEIVGQEMAEPVAGEFRKTFEEQRLGLHFREALTNLTNRVPLDDVRFFAVALIIQDETGGNLAEILGNLSATIRERFKIRGEVRVRTAQGRLTAIILTALPPGMLILLSFLNPTYCRVLFTDIYGNIAMAAATTMLIIGGLLLWKIVSIEV